MPLATCARCKKMFNKVRSPVCPKCVPAEDEDMEKVRKVLNEEEGLGAEAVAEKAEVDIRVVLRMVEQGLVQDVSLSGSFSCGRCGAPAISPTKRLCQACLSKLEQEVAQMKASIKLQQKPNANVGNLKDSVHASVEHKRRST